MFALGSAALFGMSTPLVKALVGDMPPLMLAGLLYAGSGFGLALVLALRRLSGPQVITMPRRGEWPWLAGAVFVGGVLGPVALTYGLVSGTASTASLLLNLEGVFTALIAWFLFRENFDGRILVGMLAIVLGGAVLVWSPGVQSGAWTGWLLVVFACICWAIDNNLTRKVSTSDAMLIAALKGLIAGLITLSLAWLAGQGLPRPGILGLAMAVGFFGYGVSLILFVLALRHLGTARTAAYFSVGPFFGAALAIVIQGDAVTARLLAAGVLMAFGVWLHVSERHRHVHAHVAQEHTHSHSHDKHHRHPHAFAWDGREPHSHPHAHEPLTHAHAHYPDIHHRHTH